jgi:serine carboxypeptidase-like clade II
MLLAVLSLLLCGAAVPALGAYAPDEITNLPGLTQKINFKQYAGYITVDESHGRDLFYWYVESQRSPKTDPVVLWLNGGPGCSSVAGMLTENGPFRPERNGTLRLDPASWNTIANVLYLESPAGVGFSKTNDPADYHVGDKRTANDAYIFLTKFFGTKFSELNGREFWITGESYGGHYVPELANRVLEGNQQGGNVHINIKGFMAGNAWTYMPFDNAGAVFDWWSHALNSDATYKGLMENCDFTDIGPLKADSLVTKTAPNPAVCNEFLSKSQAEMGNINIYDIYVDMCDPASSKFQGRRAAHYVEALARAGSPVHAAMSKARAASVGNSFWPPYHPCVDEFLTTYLNRQDVQAAIHANITYKWSDCSSLVHYNYSDVEKSVIPLYEKFLGTDLDILVYSGDVDAIVPTPGTRAWIASIKRPIVETWRPWIGSNKQVGGYVEKYKGFTFATVRDAGHMVPETQPERAFDMFSRFLNGKPL